MSMASFSNNQVFRIINVKGGTALDLSGGDNTTIMGYQWHGGDNQKWRVIDNGNNEWKFQNVGTGRYIYIDGYAQDGTAVIAHESNGTGFNIWQDEHDPSTYRVFVPNTRQNFDLSDHGNSTDGTKVTLWGKWEGKNQTWRFEPVRLQLALPSTIVMSEPYDANFYFHVKDLESTKVRLAPFIPSLHGEPFLTGCRDDPDTFAHLPWGPFATTEEFVETVMTKRIQPSPERVLFAILDKTKATPEGTSVPVAGIIDALLSKGSGHLPTEAFPLPEDAANFDPIVLQMQGWITVDPERMIHVKFSIPAADHNEELQRLLDWFTNVAVAHDTTVKFLLTYANVYTKPKPKRHIILPFTTPQDVFILSLRNLLFLENVKPPETSIPIVLLPCSEPASRRAATHLRSSFYDMRPGVLQAHNLSSVIQPVSDHKLHLIKSSPSTPYLPWITRDTSPGPPRSLLTAAGDPYLEEPEPEVFVTPTTCSPGDLIWIEDTVDRGQYHGVTAGPVLHDINNPGKQWLLTVGDGALPRPPQVLGHEVTKTSPPTVDDVPRGVFKFAEGDGADLLASLRFALNCDAEDFARSQIRGIGRPQVEELAALGYTQWLQKREVVARRAESCRIGTCRLAENVLVASAEPTNRQTSSQPAGSRTSSAQGVLSSSAEPLHAVNWALIELSDDFGAPTNSYLGPRIRQPEPGMPVRLAWKMGPYGLPSEYAKGFISRAPAYQVDVYHNGPEFEAEVVKAYINREFAGASHAGSAIFTGESEEGGDVVGYVSGGVDFGTQFSFGPITFGVGTETVLRRIEQFRDVPAGSMALADTGAVKGG
ncbi:hypothetical protein EIP91_001863 [Steccherinum ochraceum]|uniref:Ricin B lectin domain-containing protein n=1 Tax=Steccherinum ochraceum TaxID=92696 RepID=A0A4R0RJI8_9APHY|nr:hypothetical protein EIP91_001863 [Steccherinum ochraceum]